ncbi:MAG: hypothetical protein ABIH77_05650 [Pseudomonadota bacterium]|nr:hypothetical protein [Gammaproteobacteria bacterium]MBU1927149.1 hypothetical protein [Gammaproteobacteria bacterium]MBU2545581.1 hypothetical protein [Gammaproteobacteria bacterium]
MEDINFLPWRQREKAKKRRRFLWFVISGFLLMAVCLSSAQLYLSVWMHRVKRHNEEILLKTEWIKKKLTKLNVENQSTALMLHQIYKAKRRSDRVKRQLEVVLLSSRDAPLRRERAHKK